MNIGSNNTFWNIQLLRSEYISVDRLVFYGWQWVWSISQSSSFGFSHQRSPHWILRTLHLPSLPPHVLFLFPSSRVASMIDDLPSFCLVFGCPLFLFPRICPYQFNLLSVIFLEACVTLVVPRMCSFLILSFCVTLHVHLSILIWLTLSAFLVSACPA